MCLLQTRPLLPPAPTVVAPASTVASIDAAFHDDAALLRRAQERQRAGREKGWNRTTTDAASSGNAAAAAATAASSTSAVAAPVPRFTVASSPSASASTSSVSHPHKFTTSSRAAPPTTPQRATASAAAAAAAASPHVPSALDERQALRQERDDLAHRYAHRLEQFHALQARKRLRGAFRGWRTLACTPRDLALRARAFAQFQLLIRTLATWRSNGKAVRESKQVRAAEQAQALEGRLQQRALKFYRLKRLRVLFRSWLLAAQALAATHAASDAREERAHKMAKLLAALEKKKASGGDMTAVARPATSAAQSQQDPAHASTFSSQARQTAIAAAHSAAHQGGATADSPQRKKPLRPGSAMPSSSPMRGTTGGSSNSSSRAASTRSEIESASASGHSSEYKERLMAERAKRSASAAAASAAAAIAAGSSVHARPDMGDSLVHASPYATSAASARAAAAASLLAPVAATTGGAFAVASASSMSERAELRALRRAEIQAHQAAQEAARKAEAEAKIAEEAAAIEAAKRAALQSKRDARRAETQAAEEKARAKEMESAAHALALLHHARSQMVFFGWVPWRRLVERQRIRGRAMDQRAAGNTVRRLFARWGQAVIAGRERRAERERRKEEKATRHFVRRRLRSVLQQWKRVLSQRAQQVDLKRAWAAKQMLQRCFRALRRTCAQLRQARAQRERRLEPRIASLACTSLSRHFWLLWQTAVEHGRAERAAARKQSDLKSKVGGWLEEFRAQKARERGESATDEPATVGGATQAFARLKLDVPQSTVPAPVMLSSPARSSFVPTAALSPRSSHPLSPSSLSSYSALRHPSAQSPRLSSPLSPAAAAASVSSRVASHAEMMAVLSPRAGAIFTAARMQAPPSNAFSFDSPSATAAGLRSPSRPSAAALEYSALSSPTYHSILSSPRASAGAAVPSLDPLDSEDEQDELGRAVHEEAKSNESSINTRPTSAATAAARSAVPPAKASSSKPKPTAAAAPPVGSVAAVRARPASAARSTAPPSAITAHPKSRPPPAATYTLSGSNAAVAPASK